MTEARRPLWDCFQKENFRNYTVESIQKVQCSPPPGRSISRSSVKWLVTVPAEYASDPLKILPSSGDTEFLVEQYRIRKRQNQECNALTYAFTTPNSAPIYLLGSHLSVLADIQLLAAFKQETACVLEFLERHRCSPEILNQYKRFQYQQTLTFLDMNEQLTANNLVKLVGESWINDNVLDALSAIFYAEFGRTHSFVSTSAHFSTYLTLSRERNRLRDRGIIDRIRKIFTQPNKPRYLFTWTWWPGHWGAAIIDTIASLIYFGDSLRWGLKTDLVPNLEWLFEGIFEIRSFRLMDANVSITLDPNE